ncbi:hypothetical protein XI06_05045 [Bradyrhizobium sp. CCBAU 11434]|uniref:hypothetical protein n=1 Tax=Bradyrhizobium TaxID=374 RepID=UPI001EDB1429|nr:MULTISPECIES: hypothetical protein [Bradyrhizobium]MDA9519740.1 hypothetical protein [Bradyrhizobium sp. CCBAU 11434]
MRQARTVECNDITVALEAWDFGFGGDERKLSRFEIDDFPSSIRGYFEAEVYWRMAVRAATPEVYQ